MLKDALEDHKRHESDAHEYNLDTKVYDKKKGLLE